MSTNITIPVPAVPFAPPVYTCHRAKKPFELDGNINKPFWEDAPYTDEFLDIEVKPHAASALCHPCKNALG